MLVKIAIKYFQGYHAASTMLLLLFPKLEEISSFRQPLSPLIPITAHHPLGNVFLLLVVSAANSLSRLFQVHLQREWVH